jgi:benzoate-CoA ligase family protein
VAGPDVPEFPARFNLAHYLLDARVEEGKGAKVAVRFRERAQTYEQVQASANRAARALVELGIDPEDRVLLVLPDGPEFVAAWCGILKAGAVFAMANPLQREAELGYALEYTRAKVAFVHAQAWEEVSKVLPVTRTLRAVIFAGGPAPAAPAGSRARVLSWSEAVEAAPDDFENEPTGRDDLAGWLFTSGSTGRPKAAAHVHADFAYNVETYAKRVLEMRETDVTLSVAKLFFGYATGTNLMFPFAVGATTCLFEERSTPEAIFEGIARWRPTVLTSVPTMIQAMASHPRAAQSDLSSLRVCISAGEALLPEVYRRWRERFEVEILDGIGSAEMFHIYLSNRFGEVRPGSLGRMVPGYEGRLVDDEGRDVPDGEIGTLWIRGGSAAIGYWGDRARSRETFRGEWTVSSDLFRRDENGFYYYAGRRDDLLKVGGVFVAPVEVEECLLAHRAVAECAVVGFRDEAGLVKPQAYVVLRDGAAGDEALARELQDHVKARLAPYKYPRRISFVSFLPRNDRGKVDRKKLGV